MGGAEFETTIWLTVIAYLSIALAELLPVGFRSNRDDAFTPIHVCLVALGYGLGWPLRYWGASRQS